MIYPIVNLDQFWNSINNELCIVSFLLSPCKECERLKISLEQIEEMHLKIYIVSISEAEIGKWINIIDNLKICKFPSVALFRKGNLLVQWENIPQNRTIEQMQTTLKKNIKDFESNLP